MSQDSNESGQVYHALDMKRAMENKDYSVLPIEAYNRLYTLYKAIDVKWLRADNDERKRYQNAVPH